MTIESLARTIAKARHGTDAHWAAFLPAAVAALEEFAKFAEARVVFGVDYLEARTALGIADDLRSIAATHSPLT